MELAYLMLYHLHLKIVWQKLYNANADYKVLKFLKLHAIFFEDKGKMWCVKIAQAKFNELNVCQQKSIEKCMTQLERASL